MYRFIEVMLASVMGGLRWSLTQLLLSPHTRSAQNLIRQTTGDLTASYASLAAPMSPTSPTPHNDEENIPVTPPEHDHHAHHSAEKPQHQHPVTSILHLAPVMAVCVFLAFMVLEMDKLSQSDWFATTSSSLRILAWMTLGGCVAFSMVTAEFEVIRRVGVVTLSVAGIFKVSPHLSVHFSKAYMDRKY